ncbi:hypothetical protein [Sporomusa aerivorans]|uniref:hypothetical protein n=1 Tax=Sporomusa aerivorans TaxID=204936 RepID=UPI00352BABC9
MSTTNSTKEIIVAGKISSKFSLGFPCQGPNSEILLGQGLIPDKHGNWVLKSEIIERMLALSSATGIIYKLTSKYTFLPNK